MLTPFQILDQLGKFDRLTQNPDPQGPDWFERLINWCIRKYRRVK